MTENICRSTFLVCVNEKQHSETALRFACKKALQCNADVTMLYIINPMDYNTVFSVADVIKEDRRMQAEKLLKSLSKKVTLWSGRNAKTVIREGKIADEVINEIEANERINLLVLGVAADGSSGKGKLLPQLTNEIGDSYHVPLLVIPGNLTEEEIDALNA